MYFCFRNRTTRTQTIDFGRAESELPENFLVVFSNLRGALGGHLGDAMDLKRAADSGRQLTAGAVAAGVVALAVGLGLGLASSPAPTTSAHGPGQAHAIQTAALMENGENVGHVDVFGGARPWMRMTRW